MNEYVGRYDQAICDYIDALSEFQLDRKSLQNNLSEARMHTSIGRVLAILGPARMSDEATKAYVRYQSDLNLADSGYLGAEAAVHFLETFPDRAMMDHDSAKLELATAIHTQVVARLRLRGWEEDQQEGLGQWVGRKINGDPESWGEEVRSIDYAIELLSEVKGKDRYEYSMANVRLQTDRAKLALLQGDGTSARLYFSCAVAKLSSLIVDGGQRPDRQESSQLGAASSLRILRLELAYILLLAKDLEPNSVSPAEARRSLGLLARLMSDNAEAMRGEPHVAGLADAARRRSKDFE